jgi:hypothetical protein
MAGSSGAASGRGTAAMAAVEALGARVSLERGSCGLGEKLGHGGA